MSTPYRIALREEGEQVNAYFARTETMEGAQLVMSLRRDIACLEPVREGLMLLTQAIAIAMVERITDKPVIGIDISQAPEHERWGNA